MSDFTPQTFECGLQLQGEAELFTPFSAMYINI